MFDTLLQIVGSQQLKTTMAASAAQTQRQSAVVATRGGFGDAVTPVSFVTPFLATQPFVSYSFVILAGPILPQPPSAHFDGTLGRDSVPFSPRMAQTGTVYNVPGPISCGGVKNWITHIDGQGNTVYDGANVIIHVEWKSGLFDSSGHPTYCDGTIQHHFTFEGVSYRPVPKEVTS